MFNHEYTNIFSELICFYHRNRSVLTAKSASESKYLRKSIDLYQISSKKVSYRQIQRRYNTESSRPNLYIYFPR